MSTTPLTDAINALTTYANTVTSASDTTLSDAVATLASGYGGGGGNEDAILERTITTLTNSNVTKLGKGALYRAESLTSFTFPNVGQVAQDALQYTSITSLTDANLPSITSAGDACFAYNTALTTVNLTHAFDISGSYAFRGCTSMTDARFPNATGTLTRTFYGCTNLAVCDAGKVGSVGTNAFNGCTALRTLVLRKTGSVATLNGWSAAVMGGIYNNPSASTIYVPQSLISSYQTASNWSSAYAAGVTFAKIEGSIYEL